MKHIRLIFFGLFVFPLCSLAQQGTNQIQIAGQASIPTGDLADIVKTGFGGSVKGMYGITRKPQSLTFEAGYNRFSVKDLPSSASAHYSAIPLYAGYRANLGGIILESQAGVSFNRIAGSGPAGNASDTQTAFGWALSAGYVFRSVELGVKYQSSEADNDTFAIRFVGIRLGYNFGL